MLVERIVPQSEVIRAILWEDSPCLWEDSPCLWGGGAPERAVLRRAAVLQLESLQPEGLGACSRTALSERRRAAGGRCTRPCRRFSTWDRAVDEGVAGPERELFEPRAVAEKLGDPAGNTRDAAVSPRESADGRYTKTDGGGSIAGGLTRLQ